MSGSELCGTIRRSLRRNCRCRIKQNHLQRKPFVRKGSDASFAGSGEAFQADTNNLSAPPYQMRSN